MRPSRSGGSVPFGAGTAVPAPILAYHPEFNDIEWESTLDDSNGWIIQKSSDGRATWTVDDTAAAGERSYSIFGTGNNWWRVVRDDGLGNALAPFSNEINADDEPS